MEELMIAKRHVEQAFEEFMTLPSYTTKDRLNDAIAWFLRKHGEASKDY